MGGTEPVGVVEVSILGPVAAVRDGDFLPLGSPKQRAVLARLAVEVGRVVPLERLIDEFWGDEVPPAAANTIQAYVSRLRRVLGAKAIRTEASGYRLDLPPTAVDEVRFAASAAHGRDQLDDGDFDGAARSLREALDRWTGPALDGIPGIAVLEHHAARLEEARVRAAEDLLEADLGRGRHRDVADGAAALMAAHPLRERAYRLRMLALHRDGRQADALACFDGLCRVLDAELGVGPSPELWRLRDDIERQRVTVDWPAVKSAPDGPPPSRRGPQPATSFVGRDDELADIGSRLGPGRLVTLAGPGGAGKTRLALELARTAPTAWFVPLADLVDGARLPEHVAAALDLRLGPGDALAALAAAMRPRAGLVVFDNCEHVVNEAGAAVATILAACPDTAILATSREPLGLADETVVRVRPLALPAPDDAPLDAAACRLYVDRARAVAPDFDPEPHAAAVGALAAALDGMPLAIELAAAHADGLTPAEMLARLDLALAGPGAGRAERHRTLDSTLRWSYDSLDPAERAVFDQLAVFEAAFTMADVEAVTGVDPAPPLLRLVRVSLVDAVTDGGSTRYSLLETTRRFARDRLAASGEEDKARRRHLDWLRARVTAVAGDRGGADDLVPDVRAALTYALTDGHAPADGAVLAVGMAGYWHLHGHLDEARRWLTQALTADPSSLAVRMSLGATWQYLGDLDQAAEHFGVVREAAQAAGDALTAARALNNLGNVAALRGDLTGARRALEEAAAAADDAGAAALAVMVMNNLGQITRRQGDELGGEAIYEEALARARRLGDPMVAATILLNLAEAVRVRGDLDGAANRAAEALALAREIGYAAGMAAGLGALGNLARQQGDLDRARELYGESIEVATGMGNPALVAAGTGNLASVADDADALDEALDLYLEYRLLAESTGDRRAVVQARRGVAGIVRRRGDLRRAARQLAEALAGAVDLGEPAEIVACLSVAADLASDLGAEERVVAARSAAGATGAANAATPALVEWLHEVSSDTGARHLSPVA